MSRSWVPTGGFTRRNVLAEPSRRFYLGSGTDFAVRAAILSLCGEVILIFILENRGQVWLGSGGWGFVDKKTPLRGQRFC